MVKASKATKTTTCLGLELGQVSFVTGEKQHYHNMSIALYYEYFKRIIIRRETFLGRVWMNVVTL